MTSNVISPNFPYASQYVDVLGSKLHYIEQGNGDPILFLHGVPTSSYVWRNIIPHLSELGRCIAVDLIGFGKSAKPDIEYSINDYVRYLNAFIDTLHLKNITLVMHGWGSIAGLDYAMRNENNCKGLVFYEAYIAPAINDFSPPFLEQLLVLEKNTSEITKHASKFIDMTLPQSMTRPLTDAEITHYREPFLLPGSEKPLLKYIQEIPKKGNVTYKIIENYSKLLQKSKIPKLMLYSLPGFITTIASVMWAKKHFPYVEIIDLGEALDFAQESDPIAMGESISVWLQGIEQLHPY